MFIIFIYAIALIHWYFEDSSSMPDYFFSPYLITKEFDLHRVVTSVFLIGPPTLYTWGTVVILTLLLLTLSTDCFNGLPFDFFLCFVYAMVVSNICGFVNPIPYLGIRLFTFFSLLRAKCPTPNYGSNWALLALRIFWYPFIIFLDFLGNCEFSPIAHVIIWVSVHVYIFLYDIIPRYGIRSPLHGSQWLNFLFYF